MKVNEITDTFYFKELSSELVDIILFFSDKGWTPATSSNFSCRIYNDSSLIVISKSGVDNDLFGCNDLTIVDSSTNACLYCDDKPSAETLLHTALYNSEHINAVFHTHSVSATVVSVLYNHDKVIEFSNLEILKGLYGNSTHELLERVHIFPNTQNIVSLSEKVCDYRLNNPDSHGFLIEGHGLYTWGSSMKEAKRHVEVFEFLFEYLLRLRK